MNDFLQYTNQLQFHFWSIFVARKLILNGGDGGAIRPIGLLSIFLHEASLG